MSNRSESRRWTSTNGRLNPAEPPSSLQEVLRELAYNLHWSWSSSTKELFRALDQQAWDATRNPMQVLQSVGQDQAMLERYAERILEEHEKLLEYLQRPSQLADSPRVAYLSAEFGITDCLPIYSGGLGILAGDHLKAASDLGIPLVGVGLLYRYGYFLQTIDASGYQREQYDRVDPAGIPVELLHAADASPLTISVPFPGRSVLVHVWKAQVGRVPLYLLDTDLPENREDDRWITGHLYGGDQDTRIRQEMVLGIGGARALLALSDTFQPEVFHMNEGHSAFVALERARERVEKGLAAMLSEALVQVAPRIIFTTHTPVAAGHDAFPSDLVEAYFSSYRQMLGCSHEDLMALGRREPTNVTEPFSMTVFALRSSARRNGVSQLHGLVSREMWGDVGVSIRNIPPAVEMEAITNGVHTGTWVGPEMEQFFDATLGRRWRLEPQVPAHWAALKSAGSNDQLWEARTAQRARLLDQVEALSRAEGGPGLAPDATPARALVLGFARRFATYKRAGLLLSDPDRLARLLGGDPERPIVLVFAGKAHPRDEPGKLLMQRIVYATRDDRFRGRLIFLENYDFRLAQLMVQGSDVWLNTPRRPLEASGTSGMKAVLNGALHLSELDGWWAEAYVRGIGWGLGEGIPEDLEGEARDRAEAQQLTDVLEYEVAARFFDRDVEGLPSAWLEMARASIVELAPRFSTQRMVSEYVERMYRPSAIAAEPSIARRGR